VIITKVKDLEWSTPLQLRSELAKLFTNRYQREGDQKIAVKSGQIGHEHGAYKVVYKPLLTGAPKKAGIVKHHYKGTLRARKEVYKMLASGGRGSKHLELQLG